MSWTKTDYGSERLEVGTLAIYVRKDHSWSVLVKGVPLKEGDAQNRYSAKRAALRVAQEKVSEWSSALDRASAELEPRA